MKGIGIGIGIDNFFRKGIGIGIDNLFRKGIGIEFQFQKGIGIGIGIDQKEFVPYLIGLSLYPTVYT